MGSLQIIDGTEATDESGDEFVLFRSHDEFVRSDVSLLCLAAIRLLNGNDALLLRDLKM